MDAEAAKQAEEMGPPAGLVPLPFQSMLMPPKSLLMPPKSLLLDDPEQDGPFARRSDQRSINELPPSVTTLMVYNLSRKLSRRAFCAEMDGQGFQDLYNFVHLPIINLGTSRNKGFAFVNFVSEEAAQVFFVACKAKESTPHSWRVTVAEVQGFNANASTALKRMKRTRNPRLIPSVQFTCPQGEVIEL